MTWTVQHADCIEAMREMDEASVDAIVCDPPYGLGFMGKEWDSAAAMASRPPSAENAADGTAEARGAYPRGTGKGPQAVAFDYHAFQAWSQAWAIEALRVLKPGGHLLAFGGTRTYHRLACAVEDAGFEIRDSLIWLYGSGFPKSLDVSKAIDKAADCPTCGGGEREPCTGSCTGAGEDVPPLRHIAPCAFACPDCGGGGKATRQVVGTQRLTGTARRTVDGGSHGAARTNAADECERAETTIDLTAPATPEAQQWQGWGTALKPSHEPIIVARKPLTGTVAQNVLEHGTGALNVDATRIGSGGHLRWAEPRDMGYHGGTDNGSVEAQENPSGRWPANCVLSHLPECERVGERRVKAPPKGTTRHTALGVMNDDGWEPKDGKRPGYANPDGTETIPAYSCAPGCPVAELDRQSGEAGGGFGRRGASEAYEGGRGFAGDMREVGYGDTGGASRFFYQAKASRAERNAGLEGFEEQERGDLNQGFQNIPTGSGNPRNNHLTNSHPTVKPIDLMRWLVRLVTPPGGLVLDPFTGSGTTGIAAVLEGFDFHGIEREAEYVAIAEARLAWWSEHPEGMKLVERLESEKKQREIADSGQLGLL